MKLTGGQGDPVRRLMSSTVISYKRYPRYLHQWRLFWTAQELRAAGSGKVPVTQITKVGGTSDTNTICEKK